MIRVEVPSNKVTGFSTAQLLLRESKLLVLQTIITQGQSMQIFTTRDNHEDVE